MDLNAREFSASVALFLVAVSAWLFWATGDLKAFPIVWIPGIIVCSLALMIGSPREARREAEGCCPKCGYDLRAAPHERCPECGDLSRPRRTAARPSGSRWVC